MEQAKNELELLQQFKKAREKVKWLEDDLNHANTELEVVTQQLIESLQARGAEATASYEGIGYASLGKPRIFASYQKDDETAVFDWLRENGMESLIKDTVNKSSLSGYVKDLIESGQKLPEFINYYLKQGITLYA